MNDERELTTETIEAFGLTFTRPEFWESRVEDESTYLYWDMDGGSFRVTPRRVSVDIGAYLEGVLAEHRAFDAAWRVFPNHRGVAWVADGESRSHFYVTGRDDLLLVCSFAYDPDLYAEDDEFYAPAIDAGLEDVDAIYASLRF